jgi:hypothetical protein
LINLTIDGFYKYLKRLISSKMELKNQERKFELNKTVISNVGFDLSSDQKFCSSFASPFEEDMEKAHPLNAVFPEGFTNFTFAYEKVSGKLSDDAFIYIFYNVM